MFVIEDYYEIFYSKDIIFIILDLKAMIETVVPKEVQSYYS